MSVVINTGKEELELTAAQGTLRRSSWNGCNKNPCGLCEGDCDRDSSCKKGLKCHFHQWGNKVPGCTGDYDR